MDLVIAPDLRDGRPSIAFSGAHDPLREALLDSRQRWRDLVRMAADFAFETDRDGRFVFIAPDPAFGWPAGTLLGQPAALLLADHSGFDPFAVTQPIRGRRGWLRRPDLTQVCLSFAVAPLHDAAGCVVGLRGVGQDVSEQDSRDAAIAAALRRSEVIDHLLSRMRQEVLAPRMMATVLESLNTAMGAEGSLVVDLLGDGVQASVLHRVGTSPPAAVLHTAMTLLETGCPDPIQAAAMNGERVLVCPSHSRSGEQAGLAMWRAAGGRAWDADDLTLASSATAIVRVVLEHGTIQREMARQARTDPLTGLLNRRAFLEEVGRRIDRLERESQPGTLMFIDLDNFKQLNDRRGHDSGDEALCIVAGLLRDTVRPADLVARLGGDEFALWLDNADQFTAAERAESLRVEAPKSLAAIGAGATPANTVSVGMSIGIASRAPGRGEDVEALISRADQAMYEVKRAGRGHWRVSQGAPA